MVNRILFSMGKTNLAYGNIKFKISYRNQQNTILVNSFKLGNEKFDNISKTTKR